MQAYCTTIAQHMESYSSVILLWVYNYDEYLLQYRYKNHRSLVLIFIIMINGFCTICRMLNVSFHIKTKIMTNGIRLTTFRLSDEQVYRILLSISLKPYLKVFGSFFFYLHSFVLDVTK